MHQIVRRTRRQAHGLIVIALLMLFAPPWTTSAHAQALGFQVPRGPIPRPVRIDELDELARLVDLSPEQRRAIDHLHERYVAAYRPERRRRWQHITDLSEGITPPDPVAAGALRRDIRDGRAWAKQANEAFLASVLDVLSPEQRNREEAIRLRHRRARCDLSLFQIPASTWDPVVPDFFLLLFTGPVREQVPDQAFELWLAYERQAVDTAERFDEWIAMSAPGFYETDDSVRYFRAGRDQVRRDTDAAAIRHAITCVFAIAELFDDPIDRGMVFRPLVNIFYPNSDMYRFHGNPAILDPWAPSAVRRELMQDAPCTEAVREASLRQTALIEEFLRTVSRIATDAAADLNERDIRFHWLALSRELQANVNRSWNDVRAACPPAAHGRAGTPLQYIDRRVWSVEVVGPNRDEQRRLWPTGSPTGSISLRWMQRVLAGDDAADQAIEEAFLAHEAAWGAHPALQAPGQFGFLILVLPDVTESTEAEDRDVFTDVDRRRREAIAAARELDQRWFRMLRGVANLDDESRELLNAIEQALTLERLTRWCNRVQIGQDGRAFFASPLTIVVASELDREDVLTALRLLLVEPRAKFDHAEAFSAAQLQIVLNLDMEQVATREERRGGAPMHPSRERHMQWNDFRQNLLKSEAAARLAWIRAVQERLGDESEDQFTRALHRIWLPELDRSDHELERVLNSVLGKEAIEASRMHSIRDLIVSYRTADAESRRSLTDVVLEAVHHSEGTLIMRVLNAAYAEQLVHHWEMRRRIVDRLREILTEAEANALGLNPSSGPNQFRSLDIGMPREIVYPPMR